MFQYFGFIHVAAAPDFTLFVGVYDSQIKLMALPRNLYISICLLRNRRSIARASINARREIMSRITA